MNNEKDNVKAYITTVPFGASNKTPIDLLDSANLKYDLNPYGRKITEDELASLIHNYTYLIAGTEIISKKVLNNARNLKLISRVGVGLDGIDLLTARKKNIKITYTPDAPGPAVAELTLGLMINLIRSINISNYQMHNGQWNRLYGKRIAYLKIGIIGLGRIGIRVLRRLRAFGTPVIYANDIIPNTSMEREYKIIWATKEEIYKNCDLISLHLPLTIKTINMITKKELLIMKKDAYIINTSRGGIINEKDLANVMRNGHLAGAAIDVFENEPYSGELGNINNIILTSHMGSMSEDCRARMEIEATSEVCRYHYNEPLVSQVPDFEYNVQNHININESINVK